MYMCEVINKRSMNFAGINHSGPLSDFPDACVRVELELYSRKQDFTQIINPHICYSPHYEKGNLGTYWACFEVEGSVAIPLGVTTFALPEQKYAVVVCNGSTIAEAYQWVYKWIEETGIQRKLDMYEIECYYKNIEDDTLEEKVEIWVPVA
ncbi:GyrI-like domain-containing protein [Paenibacillus ginsengarvi]|nr:GyrI-like domain-containing protein [Paenibacillus ginsengarvi]